MNHSKNSASALENNDTADSIVIGRGLSGLATPVRFSKAGLRVVCLEPEQNFGRIVGECVDCGHFIPWNRPGFIAERLCAFFQQHTVKEKLNDDSYAVV